MTLILRSEFLWK